MIYITQLIFIHPGKEDVFHLFEELAFPLIPKYNGKVEYRVKPHNVEGFIHSEELPYEIHIISFPSDKDLVNYMQDKERNKFLHLKTESVRSVLLIKGEKI